MIPAPGLFHSRIQVVEVAEKLVETVYGRQVRITVTQVVLAELAGDVPPVLQQLSDGGRPLGDALG